MADPSSKMRRAPVIITSCASTLPTAGPMMGMLRRAAAASISASTASRGGSRPFMYRSISGLTITENPLKNPVHMAKLPFERKAHGDLLGAQHARDFRVGGDRGAKVRIVLPSLHGV